MGGRDSLKEGANAPHPLNEALTVDRVGTIPLQHLLVEASRLCQHVHCVSTYMYTVSCHHMPENGTFWFLHSAKSEEYARV